MIAPDADPLDTHTDAPQIDLNSDLDIPPLGTNPSMTPEQIGNLELYTELRYEFDKLDRLFARHINKGEPLTRPLVLLRRKIRLGRAYEVMKSPHDGTTGVPFRALAAHAYRYFELIFRLEKARYLTRESAQHLAIRSARILELADPKISKLFGVTG